MRVTILHPDLGIGGAERLIVDVGVALQSRGHQVKVITAQYDQQHSFKETEGLDIDVIRWWPRTLFGSMWAFCAYMRMCLAALYICMFVKSDVIVTDQVSASLIVFKMFSHSRLVFYCHFPDQLLTTRETTAKAFYRYFLDVIEERTTALADVICVNSLFTASIVRRTFPTLKNRELTVVYPSLNTEFFDTVEDVDVPEVPSHMEYVFTSLNRYEIKKNVKLALDAFAELSRRLPRDVYEKCHLVIAGGYDKLNEENIAHYADLVRHADELGISGKVTFMRSPSDAVKVALLKRSCAVLYTPHNEHFGIVPVEAMYLGRPVIAVNSGGPMESICHEKTGFLVEQNAECFANAMQQLIETPELRDQIAEEGPERVIRMFSFDSFTTKLDAIVKDEE